MLQKSVIGEVEPKIEIALVNAGIGGVEQEFLAVHGGVAAIGNVVRRADPIKVSGVHAINGWMDVRSLVSKAAKPLPGGDRLGKMLRRTLTQCDIDVGQVLAIQLVKIRVILGVVLGAVPPVPVTALRDQEFFVCEVALCRSGGIGMFGKEVARGGKIIPCAIVLRRSDPDIEVGIDPRTGRQLCQWREVLGTVAFYRLGNREAVDNLVILHSLIQPPQEFPT